MSMTGIRIGKEQKKWMFLFAYGIYLVAVILFASKYEEMDYSAAAFGGSCRGLVLL